MIRLKSMLMIITDCEDPRQLSGLYREDNQRTILSAMYAPLVFESTVAESTMTQRRDGTAASIITRDARLSALL